MCFCAAKFQKHMEEAVKNPGGRKKVHGKNLMPHELVQIYFDGTESVKRRLKVGLLHLEGPIQHKFQWLFWGLSPVVVSLRPGAAASTGEIYSSVWRYLYSVQRRLLAIQII